MATTHDASKHADLLWTNEVIEERNLEMKRFAITFGICALLLVPAVASAQSHTWDGRSSDVWKLADNWSGAVTYAGEGVPGDTALIDDGTNEPTVVVGGAVPRDLDWIEVDAETAGVDDVVNGSVDMTLKIDTGGDLDVLDGNDSGYIWLIAGRHTFTPAKGIVTYADDAKLWVAAGSLEVDDIYADGGFMSCGGIRGDRGLVILDFDVDPEINDDVIETGEANFVIDDDTTIESELTVGDGSDYGDVIQSGASSLTVNDAMTIQAGNETGEDSIYKLSAGTLNVEGLASILAAQGADANATIWVAAGTFAPDAMTFDGGATSSDGLAIGDFDVCVEVQGAEDNSTDTFISDYVEWQLGSGVKVDAKDMELNNNGAGFTVIGNSSHLCTYSYTGNGQSVSVSGTRWCNGASCDCSCE
jgi:signal peptidase I